MDLNKLIATYVSGDDVEITDPKQQLRLIAERILDDIGPRPGGCYRRIESPDYPEGGWKPDKQAAFAVTVTETSASKTVLYFDELAFSPLVTTAKEAFQEALNLFHSPDNRERRAEAEEITSCSYVVEVEDMEGNLYLFNERDDDGMPFVPENHLQEP